MGSEKIQSSLERYFCTTFVCFSELTDCLWNTSAGFRSRIHSILQTFQLGRLHKYWAWSLSHDIDFVHAVTASLWITLLFFFLFFFLHNSRIEEIQVLLSDKNFDFWLRSELSHFLKDRYMSQKQQQLNF